MAYEPRGKIKVLLDAMGAQPARIWTADEVAKVMGVQPYASTLVSYTHAAINAGMLFRRVMSGATQYRRIPFESAPETSLSARQGTNTGWKPPQMTCVRPGAEQPHARGGSTVTPAAAAPAGQPEVGRSAAKAQVVQEQRESAGDAGAPAPAGAETKPAVRETEAAGPETAGDDLPQHSGLTIELDAEPQADPVEPDAFISCRTGSITIVGIDPDEEGRVEIPPELVQRIKRYIAWGPTA